MLPGRLLLARAVMSRGSRFRGGGVEGRSPPQNVGGLAALGPATRLLKSTKTVGADNAPVLECVSLVEQRVVGKTGPKGRTFWLPRRAASRDEGGL